jgi:hypothetical protein
VALGKVSDVVWWIVAGVSLLAVVIFGAVMAALAGRLRPLRRGVGRLQARAEEAQKLQSKVMDMQERALGLAERAEEAAAAAERLRRPGADLHPGLPAPPGGSGDGARVRGSR